MNQNLIIEEIRRRAIRLEEADDLDALVEAAGDRQIVMLGEASHGTSEFYSLRAELTRRLIERKGFSFLAVEGDWPSCYTLNGYIKGARGAAPDAREALRDFNRWPTWMWANREMMELAEWLRSWNDGRTNERKVGFYGLDVYSLWESIDAVIRHLEQTGSPELAAAKRAFECFEPHNRDAQSYGVSAAFLSERCRDEVVALLTGLQEKRRGLNVSGLVEAEAALSDELNALVAVNAERYYHSMVRGGSESWNIRDQHMVEALHRLMAFHGANAKAVIWEHNTHIGDARATDMVEDGSVNVGQLVRERYGMDRVYAVGFGTHRGTVVAGREWGAPMQEMKVPSAIRGSWEDLVHQAGAFDKLLFFDQQEGLFRETIGHRAIGVVYHPEYERGNYVPSEMALRYDAFIHVDESKALRPLNQEVLAY